MGLRFAFNQPNDGLWQTLQASCFISKTTLPSELFAIRLRFAQFSLKSFEISWREAVEELVT